MGCKMLPFVKDANFPSPARRAPPIAPNRHFPAQVRNCRALSGLIAERISTQVVALGWYVTPLWGYVVQLLDFSGKRQPFSPGSRGRSGRVFRLLTAASLALSPIASAGPDISWDQVLYNPKPLADDILFPLPCGGAMAFRPVETEATGPFGDQRIELGGNTAETGYLEHTRPAFVAGAFDSPSPANRRLLVGKYEVTRLQYEAVMGSDSAKNCPEASGGGRIPQTRVSWHDAAGFAHAYSLWLRDKAADISECAGNGSPCLPREDGTPAFVRLPTEAEWELAARGGAAVTPADFREPTYPMPEGLERHVWFNETADGDLKPIGLLESNPLGLHDILGNAEEIVLEPFRLNRLDRLHGQPGGYMVRGGSVHSDRSEIRASLRREVPFYDDRGAVKTADTGFRLVASVPVIRSANALDDIRAAWGRLGSADESVPPRPPDEAAPPPPISDESFDDPILELSALARKTTDPDMAKRLEQLRARVAANAQRLYDQRNLAAREAMRFGGLLCQKLHDEGHNMALRRQRQRLCVKREGADNKRCRKGGDTLLASEEILSGNVRFFADTVIRTAQNYADDLGVLDDQLEILKAELGSRGIGALGVYPAAFHTHVLEYAYDGSVERDSWYETCVKLQ